MKHLLIYALGTLLLGGFSQSASAQELRDPEIIAQNLIASFKNATENNAKSEFMALFHPDLVFVDIVNYPNGKQNTTIMNLDQFSMLLDQVIARTDDNVRNRITVFDSPEDFHKTLSMTFESRFEVYHDGILTRNGVQVITLKFRKTFDAYKIASLKVIETMEEEYKTDCPCSVSFVKDVAENTVAVAKTLVPGGTMYYVQADQIYFGRRGDRRTIWTDDKTYYWYADDTLTEVDSDWKKVKRLGKASNHEGAVQLILLKGLHPDRCFDLEISFKYF